MKKKRALAASRDPGQLELFDTPQPKYKILGSDAEAHSIIFNTGTAEEMLRVTKDGFYVRGQRVPADEKEAELVYNAFKEFLVYHQLARSY